MTQKLKGIDPRKHRNSERRLKRREEENERESLKECKNYYGANHISLTTLICLVYTI